VFQKWDERKIHLQKFVASHLLSIRDCCLELNEKTWIGSKGHEVTRCFRVQLLRASLSQLISLGRMSLDDVLTNQPVVIDNVRIYFIS
jgi:hypothetical protein